MIPCMDGEVMVDGDYEARTAYDLELLQTILKFRSDVAAGHLDPRLPTPFKPGSTEKKALLAIRCEHGLPLWHDDDPSHFSPEEPDLPPGTFTLEEHPLEDDEL